MSLSTQFRAIAALLGLVALSGLLYAWTSDSGESAYFENMALLRHAQQLDAQWDAEVLRSKTGINSNYDPLVAPLTGLSELLEQLQTAVVQSHAEHVDQDELQTGLDALHTAFDTKAQLIERFKSHNSLLQNSLAFLPVIAGDIRAAALEKIAEHQLQRDFRRGITAVLLTTLIHSQSGASDRELEIKRASAALVTVEKRIPREIAVQMTAFHAHVTTVLREQAVVDDLLRRIADVPTTARLEDISSLLDAEWRVTSVQAQQHRRYLLALSLVMGLLLTYAAVRLVRNHNTINRVNRQLQQANETLEQRVQDRTQELGSSYAMLHATLEATPDAIFAIQGEAVFFNTLYREMWNVPDEVLRSADPWDRVRWNAAQVKDPEAYIAYISQRGKYPDAMSSEVFELKDGRFIRRHVRPQRIGGQVVGVVISFRDITQHRRDRAELAKIHQQLLVASRQAGMAEVATGVLHNVGNVLNSVNVSANLVADSAKQSKLSSLVRVAALLREHEGELGRFVEQDPRGKHLVGFLSQLAEHLQGEQQTTVREMEALRSSVDHIKEIVAMQQSCAKISGVIESLDLVDLVEDTLRISNAALQRHGVTVERQFEAVPPIDADRHKILQILVNLVTNAKRACSEGQVAEKRLIVRISRDAGVIKIAVSDNGVGIAPENLTRVFGHGFTTRKDGHGFGLHSGALAARELGGALHAHSAGLGLGATFTLELPLQAAELAYGT